MIYKKTDSTDVTDAAEPNPKLPKFKFRVNRIGVGIWKFDAGYSTILTPSYKGKDGQWHDTVAFCTSDLPALASAAQFALTLILNDEMKGAK
jgi:hypothetical protein